MAQPDIALMAHLLRRAGFGATREELERDAARGYEATVEALLHPEDGPPALEDEDLVRRYHVDENSLMLIESCQTYWLYRMINTRRPLEEKLALFWHGVFATGYTKLNQPKAILRHLYNFFVADEPPVPAWATVPPRDPEAMRLLMHALVDSGYEIRAVLRVLYNADFFKTARFTKVKSPTELVVGTVRLTGGHGFPALNDIELALETGYMGQQLLDPPSVEGWHTGTEWINTATLMTRVNFAARQFVDAEQPGVRAIIDRLRAQGPRLSPERLVEAVWT